MKRHVIFAVIMIMVCGAGNGAAREVRLQAGETYSDEDLLVICEGGSAAAPLDVLTLKECQHWDSFTKKCLYEKKIHSYRGLECTEECQHWDTFSQQCYYRTECEFHPDHKAFIRRTCAEFDDYSKQCLRVTETRIGPAGRRGRE